MNTIAQLHDWLDRHGADPAHWPAAGRDAIDALLAQSSDARAELAQARQLARLLDGDAVPAPSAALRANVLARAPQARRSVGDALRELWSMLGGFRIAGPALAAALVLGTSLGAIAAPEDEPDDVDLAEAARLASEYPEL